MGCNLNALPIYKACLSRAGQGNRQGAALEKPQRHAGAIFAFCARLHTPFDLYELAFEKLKADLTMNFHKKAYLVGRTQVMRA